VTSTPKDAALARALSALSARHGEILDLTERLVRVNSYTSHIAGVNAVGKLLCEALLPSDLHVEVTWGTDTGDHLTFRTEAARHAPAILLIGHHDTVFPPGTFESYSIEGDTVRGPGVLDMKGGLAIIVVVLLALRDANLLHDMPLCFVSVADEEIGSPSSRPMLEALAKKARAGLVFEAGRAADAIITARRGSGSASVVATGKAAHAGNALATGRSAIWALAKFIDHVQTLTDEARGLSVNVGLVSGGSARNTVPADARCDVDLRFADAEGERDLSLWLHEAAQRAQAAVEGTRVDVKLEITRKPWSVSPEGSALCDSYAQCQREAGLEANIAPPIGGGSDANTVAAVGLPVIDGLGPRGVGFHTHYEQISVSSLPLKAEALLRFLVRELG